MSQFEKHPSVQISVVITTLNEERNLPYCLRSIVPWASDIVLVDMHSTDGTRDIAERYGARVFLHEPVGFAEPARAFAVTQARCDWVLLLDADELISPPLYQEICRLIASGQIDVLKLPRRNYMFGAPVEHTGWGAAADSQTRVFKKSALSITDEIHRSMQPLPEARVVTIDDRPEWNLVHFNYISVHQFIEKLNRYTSIEAEQTRD
ncbi:MAG TPA: glycosyltransferase family 2 protein, partial [Polyangiaceae bacterium]